MVRIENNLLNYESKYSLPNGTLKNELGITDNDELERIERLITTFRLAKLYLNPSLSLGDDIKPFSLEHYLNIHKYLFNGIYPFAGEIRDEVIKKSYAFCLPERIYDNLKNTIDNMRKISRRVSNRKDLVDFITYYYSVLNIIHPFREGNGRCEREFLRQYISYICENNLDDEYYLDFNLITDKKEFADAIVNADIGLDNKSLRNIFDNILVSGKKHTR